MGEDAGGKSGMIAMGKKINKLKGRRNLVKGWSNIRHNKNKN